MSKHAISNIAWSNDLQIEDLSELFHEFNVEGIECAPNKLFGCDIANVTPKMVEECKKRYNDLGFCIPAFQAILYGHPEMNVFDKSSHYAMFEHLKKTIECAKQLGAKVLVFGAPKNKLHNSTLLDDALNTAIDFFRELGDIASRVDCIIGIEANPREYGCNFLTNKAEVDKFLSYVNHRSIQFHFDVGASIMNNEDFDASFSSNYCYMHLSAPFLKNLSDFSVQYKHIANEIKKSNCWTSIEMKSVDNDEIMHLRRALYTAFGD